MSSIANKKVESKTENNTSKVSRIITANVISASMDKTAVVSVEVKVPHPLYGKYIKKTTKYYVHDESNSLKVGDVVNIKQSRPISKLKRWVLEEVVGSQSV